nr:transposase [Anaerolineae bacterium]
MKGLRRTYKYRLYRCDKRDRHLHQQIDIACEIWNHGIALQRQYYRLCGGYITKHRLQKHIAKLKRGAKYARWRELDAQAAQDVIERLDRAYKRFFAREGGRPGFRKRRKYRSFTVKQASWEMLEGNTVKIRGRIYKVVKHRPIKGTIKTVTVKRDSLNRLWVCFSVIEAFEPEAEVSTGETGGFDFGLKTFLTDHTGQTHPMPEYLRADLKRIQRLSRDLSRKRKGSHNREKARRNLAQAHERVANRRREFHFKLAHDLCDQYDVLCFEDLNLRGMKSLWGRKVSD